uniref:Uncharacterized protein n=1 Tax=Glossina palpalis gambiensis TaxID=67801 RepID=A0A1B0C431_9MUSC
MPDFQGSTTKHILDSHPHIVHGFTSGSLVLNFLPSFLYFTGGTALISQHLERVLPYMKPSIAANNTSQSADESLATRFDREFRRFQFGRSNATEEYSTRSSAGALFNSLGRKLDALFKMSYNESRDNAHDSSGNSTENDSNGRNQPGTPAETASSNQQVVDMLKHQNEVLLSCMQEIRNLKIQTSTETRQGQLRESEGAQNFAMAASTSTPN